MRRIGIFGGSFNPIHFGHIRLARYLLLQAGLDEVWFVVSPQNPMKQRGEMVDEDMRYEMVQIALNREQGLEASDVELQMPRPSYTWHTLQKLKADFPDCEFTLIVGADNWELFPKWYHASDIISNYPIVVYPRSGSKFDTQNLPPNVRVVYTRRINISSTQVRRRIREGHPINGLVPKEVAAYIARFGLYQEH